MCVSYFDQCLGAAQFQCWLKIAFSCFYDGSLYEKSQKLMELMKKKEFFISDIISELEFLDNQCIDNEFSFIEYLTQRLYGRRRTENVIKKR